MPLANMSWYPLYPGTDITAHISGILKTSQPYQETSYLTAKDEI